MTKAAQLKSVPQAPAKANIPSAYTIKLITPMVGGGAVAGDVDLDMPIRATAIRGHLRFWWRVMIGSYLGDDMWNRENAIFGSTETPSPLDIRVVSPCAKPEDLIDPLKYCSRGNCEARYTLYSSIEQKDDYLKKGYLLKEGYSFDLYVAWKGSSLREFCNASDINDRNACREIILALKTWLTFGGVGARTRRGCGALYAMNFPFFKTSTTATDRAKELIEESIALSNVSSPHAVRFRVYAVDNQKAKLIHLDAWKHGMKAQKAFNGSEYIKSTKREENIAQIPIKIKISPNRAAVGMPVNYKEKDKTATLEPHSNSGARLFRMSSPAIFKPMAMTSTDSVPVLIVLDTPNLKSVCLRYERQEKPINLSEKTAGVVIQELINEATNKHRYKAITP